MPVPVSAIVAGRYNLATSPVHVGTPLRAPQELADAACWDRTLHAGIDRAEDKQKSGVPGAISCVPEKKRLRQKEKEMKWKTVGSAKTEEEEKKKEKKKCLEKPIPKGHQNHKK